MEKIKILIKNKIKDHENEINNSEISEELMNKKLKEGLSQFSRKSHSVAILATELQTMKDKVLFHKGAIAALQDLLDILEINK